MFRTVITFDDNLDDDTLNKMKKLADKHFDNRIETIKNISEDKNILVYQSDKESGYCATLMANCTLYREDGFKDVVAKWTWENTKEQEIEDVLVELAIPVRHVV